MKLVLCVKNSAIAADHPFLNQKYKWENVKYRHGFDNQLESNLLVIKFTPKWFVSQAMSSVDANLKTSLLSDEPVLSELVYYEKLLRDKMFGASANETFKSLSINMYPIDTDMKWLSDCVMEEVPEDVFDFFDESKMSFSDKLSLLALDIEIMILPNLE